MVALWKNRLPGIAKGPQGLSRGPLHFDDPYHILGHLGPPRAPAGSPRDNPSPTLRAVWYRVGRRFKEAQRLLKKGGLGQTGGIGDWPPQLVTTGTWPLGA